MKKMSEFLDLPVEPAFRETQVILTGKRRAIVENYRNLPALYKRGDHNSDSVRRLVIHGKRLEISCIQHLKCVSADGSKAFCLRRERKNDSWFCKTVRYRRTA